jgi:hypothetical protein
MFEMLEVPTFTDKVPWRPTIAKILVVLLFPLIGGFSYGSIYFANLLYVSGFAFTIIDTMLIVLISILLLLPGIYFERRMKSRPISTRVRRSAFAAIAAVWLIPFILIPLSPPPPTMPILYLPLSGIPILSIAFFVILPLLNREFIIRQTPEKYHSQSYIEMSNIFKKQIGRRRFLPLMIWSALLFSPLLSFGSWNIQLESLLYTITLVLRGPTFMDGLGIEQIIYSIPMTYFMHGSFLIFSLRFIFIRDIFRFTEGKVPYFRLISMGILSEIAPAAMLTLQQFATIMVLELPFGFYSWILPTPFFPLLGYLFIRLSKATFPFDTLWDDEEHRMWFEERQREQAMDLGIKVPISYLIRSRLRRLRK